MRTSRVASLIVAAALVVGCTTGTGPGAPTGTPADGTQSPAAPGTTGPAASPTDAGGTTGEPIVFGGNVSMTGPSAVFGQQFLDSYEFYRDTVNEKGGIRIGDVYHPVELKYYDDRSDPTTGANLIEKLITDDGVNFLWGSASSTLNFAATVVNERHKRPMVIGGGGAADDIYERGFDYVFTNMASAREYLHPAIDVLAALDDPPATVAILARNDLFPTVAAEGARERAESHGMEIVYFEQFPVEVTDLTTPISQARSLDPDVFIVSAYSGEQILAMRQMKEARFAPRFVLMPNGPIANDWATSLGEDGNYVIYPVQWVPAMTWSDPLFGSVEEFTQAFEERYDRTPQYFEVQAVAALEILQLGIESCQCLDPVQVRDAIAALEVELISGPLKFAENGRNETVAQAAIQLQPGNERVVLFPPEFATGELIDPFPAWDAR